MTIRALDTSREYVPAPEGQHVAVCCDIVDLGEVETEWEGKKSVARKVRLVFQIAEAMDDGRPFTVSRTFNCKLGPKTALRQFLEAWRGTKYTQAEAEGFRTKGLDLETLMGQNALLQVVHNNANDTTYANVQSIMRLPAGMQPLTVEDYTRVKDRDGATDTDAADEDEDDSDDGLPF